MNQLPSSVTHAGSVSAGTKAMLPEASTAKLYCEQLADAIFAALGQEPEADGTSEAEPTAGVTRRGSLVSMSVAAKATRQEGCPGAGGAAMLAAAGRSTKGSLPTCLPAIDAARLRLATVALSPEPGAGAYTEVTNWKVVESSVALYATVARNEKHPELLRVMMATVSLAPEKM